MMEVGDKIGTRWRLEAAISSGDLGQSHSARDVESGERVDVKLLRSGGAARRDRLLREVQRAARIKHVGLAAVHEVGVTGDGDVYAVVAHVEGESLSKRLARLGKMTPAEAARLAIPICRALAAAHDVGVAHRDVRPANVIVTTMSEALEPLDLKLIDLGFAKVPGASTPPEADDARFSAPEHDRNEPVGRRADVYAMGVLLQTMVSGSAAKVPTASELGALASVVQRCSADDPRGRYLGAAELEAALVATIPQPEARRLLSSLPPRMPSAAPPPDSEPPQPAAPRVPPVAAVAPVAPVAKGVSVPPRLAAPEAAPRAAEAPPSKPAPSLAPPSQQALLPPPAPAAQASVVAAPTAPPRAPPPPSRAIAILRASPILPVATIAVVTVALVSLFGGGPVPWILALLAAAVITAIWRWCVRPSA